MGQAVALCWSELENTLMKPLTTATIGALVVAVAVFGYLYYQRTRNDSF
jgi:hypothetical protein